MTQALLNNLENLQTDDRYSVSNMQPSETMDSFDVIFDKTTERTKEEKIKDDESSKGDDSAAQTNTAHAEDKKNDTAADLASKVELACAIELAVASEVKETDEEAQSDDAVTDITGECEVVEDETMTAAADTEENNDENTITDENKDTTITNEDSTMNNQLKTAPENPAAAVLMQTQINTQSKLVQKSETTNNISETVSNSVIKDSISDERQFDFDNAKIVFLDSAAKSTKEQPTSHTGIKTLKDLVREETIKELNVQSVSSTSAEEGETGDLMQYQTPQEQAIKVMLHGDMKFQDIKIAATEASKANEGVKPGRILEQISKHIENMTNTSKVNIVLNPESLGKVTLNIINTKAGLSAHFLVTNAETQNILLKGIAGLRESLLAQGISVDNVIVKLSESDNNEGESDSDWTEQDNSEAKKDQEARKQKKNGKNFEQTMFEINMG